MGTIGYKAGVILSAEEFPFVAKKTDIGVVTTGIVEPFSTIESGDNAHRRLSAANFVAEVVIDESEHGHETADNSDYGRHFEMFRSLSLWAFRELR